MAVIICCLRLKKQWQERAYLIVHKERGIPQNGYESISLKPADFSLWVIEGSLQGFGCQIWGETLQAFGWSHFLEPHNLLCKKWKSQFPKLHQAMLENFVATRSHPPCWSHQKIINIKEIHSLKERLFSLLSTHLPALLFTFPLCWAKQPSVSYVCA